MVSEVFIPGIYLKGNNISNKYFYKLSTKKIKKERVIFVLIIGGVEGGEGRKN